MKVAVETIRALHSFGIAANFSLKTTLSLSKLIPELLKEGYTHLVIIGDKELSSNTISVKDLSSRKQVEVKIPVSAESLRQIF